MSNWKYKPLDFTCFIYMCESVCPMTFHHMHWLTEPPHNHDTELFHLPQTNSHMLFLGYILSSAIHPDKQLFSISLISWMLLKINRTAYSLLKLAFHARVLRSIQAVGWIGVGSFSLLKTIPFYRCTSLIIHLFAEGHLGCFRQFIFVFWKHSSDQRMQTGSIGYLRRTDAGDP